MSGDVDVLALSSQVLMGVGLAAACGLRAFLPMLLMGIFERASFLTLGEHFQWLGSTPALVVFGSAVVLEVLADKVPWLDHALDTAGLVVKPVAGAMLASAAIVDMDPLLSAVLGLVTGASVTGAVHVAKAGARIASTTFTAGLANPVLSVAEDVGGGILALLALLVPVVAVGMLLVAGLVAWRLLSRRRRARARLVAA